MKTDGTNIIRINPTFDSNQFYSQLMYEDGWLYFTVEDEMNNKLYIYRLSTSDL